MVLGDDTSLCTEGPSCLYLCAVSAGPANTRASENVRGMNGVSYFTYQRLLASPRTS